MKQHFRLAAMIALLTVLMAGIQSCTTGSHDDDTTESTDTIARNKYPAFSQDSAYAFIRKQVSFGYRIPGTEAHKRCADWLFEKLKEYCDTVYYQRGTAVTWDKKTIPVYNIVGSFKPKAAQRGIFASHWDSRPWADNDTVRTDKPIDAANDGASGVGVLLEMARLLSKNKPEYGVDIVFFDAEDYGKSEYENSFCLGSQYWGKNPHLPGYKAQYGVLLDMVGGKNALFGKEGYSNMNAGWVQNHVWNLAAELGYQSTFINETTQPIIDDHYYVFQTTGIPMIDVIQYDRQKGFAHYWHTHADNMDAVDPKTLGIVGHTMMALVFNPPINIIK